jgi:hypothetical protein
MAGNDSAGVITADVDAIDGDFSAQTVARQAVYQVVRIVQAVAQRHRRVGPRQAEGWRAVRK